MAYGTGITSGLDTPRAKYKTGTDNDAANENDIQENDVQGLTEKELSKLDPEVIKAAYDIVKEKTLPSEKETLADFLTSFGASAGDPTELQTWGSALGKTAQRFQAIQQPKLQAASKYGAQAALASIRGMSKNDFINMLKGASSTSSKPAAS